MYNFNSIPKDESSYPYHMANLQQYLNKIKTDTMPKVKTIPVYARDLSMYPNFAASGSVKGMRKLYYGKGALLVRMGAYIYNVPLEVYNSIP
jgi:hypothetical protein